MTQNIHEIKTLVAGLNKALRSFEESGHMSNMMADYVEDSIPKVIDYVNRAHSCSQKADDTIRKIETDKVVSMTDVMYIEQAYPGFHDRTDKVFTMSDSSQGLAGAIEAINWAKVGKVGIIGAILAAIASIIALIIKRRRDPDGVIKQMKINAKKKEQEMIDEIKRIDDKWSGEGSDLENESDSMHAEAINEKYGCNITARDIAKAFAPVSDQSLDPSIKADVFNESIVNNLLMKVIASTTDETIKDRLAKVGKMEKLFSVSSPYYKLYKSQIESIKVDDFVKTISSVKKSSSEKGVPLKERVMYLDRLEAAIQSLEASMEKIDQDAEKANGSNYAVFLRKCLVGYGKGIDEQVDLQLLFVQNNMVNKISTMMTPLTSNIKEIDQMIDEVISELEEGEEKEVVTKSKTSLTKGLQVLAKLMTQTKNYYTIFNDGVDGVSYLSSLPTALLDLR